METATHEFIGPNEFRGYGHEFEKIYTVNQIKGSTGHHRIISYRFGSLNFIVRHETDGYVDDGTVMRSSIGKDQKIDSLSNTLGSLSLSVANSDASLIPVVGSKLTVKKEGRVNLLESTIEIKTRVCTNLFPLKISRGCHKPLSLCELTTVQVHFQRPQLEDVMAHIKGWEACNQADLKKAGRTD